MAQPETTDEHPFVQKLRDAQANTDSPPAETTVELLPEGSARVYFDPPKRSK